MCRSAAAPALVPRAAASNSGRRATAPAAAPAAPTATTHTSPDLRRPLPRSATVTTATVAAVAAAAPDAAFDFTAAEFELAYAPVKDLLPAGPWKAIEGGICAPKGFKVGGSHPLTAQLNLSDF